MFARYVIQVRRRSEYTSAVAIAISGFSTTSLVHITKFTARLKNTKQNARKANTRKPTKSKNRPLLPLQVCFFVVPSFEFFPCLSSPHGVKKEFCCGKAAEETVGHETFGRREEAVRFEVRQRPGTIRTHVNKAKRKGAGLG